MTAMRNGHDIPSLAVGKWRGILATLGVDQRWLSRKNGPCPMCGGKDRYRFTDFEARGMWVCSKCGAGDGFALLMGLKGWDFKTAAAQVGEIVGGISRSPTAPIFDQKAECRRLWRASGPVTMDTATGRYLHRRVGLTQFPACLRHTDRLRYEEVGQPVSWHPGMLSLVRDALGRSVSLHRIYLTDDGQKANVANPKKCVRGKLPRGSAIRLGDPVDGVLGIAEGVETAIAAGLRFGVTAWSAISADGMAQWICQDDVRRLVIFSDRDQSFTGQWAAYACARANRVKRCDLEIAVEIPEAIGDWADK